VITVAGCVADELGLAFTVEAVDSSHPGRSFDVRRRARAYPAGEYLRAQPSTIPVDVNHEGPVIGQVAYLERNGSGRLHAVAEIDASGLDDGPWYYSPFIEHVEGRDIVLQALSVTRTPASIALPPISAFPARLPDAGAYRGIHQDLVKRAAAYDRRRRSGEPHLIVDPDREARLNRLVGRRLDDPTAALEYRMLVEEDTARRRPIRHGPPGRVLRVS